MKVFRLSFAFLLVFVYGGLSAQGTPVPATDDTDDVETTDLTISDLTAEEPMDTRDMGSMIEFGITPGYNWVGGDVDATGGYGVGMHLRKSLDHIFSLRVDGLYAASSGDNETGLNRNNRRFESRWLSGTGYAVVTMNNFAFKGDTRKMNVFAMGGAGFNYFLTEAQRNAQEGGGDNGLSFDEDNTFKDNSRNKTVPREFATHAAVGAGINFRISPRFNVGVEYQALLPLGKRADLIDGYKSGGNFRDVQNVASLALNINLGNRARKVEPRYWTNVFTPVKEDIAKVNRRVDEATMDDDGDGVVNAVDQEANTPAGVPVDTRGRVLDSDKDGVADYRDLEPFFPPRAGEIVDENGVVINRSDKPVTEDRVQEMIDASIARAQQDGGLNGTTNITTNNGASIYLPMIYFPLDQATIKYSDYGTLSSVARVMQGNPGMQLVIRGYTDRTGSAEHNQLLSYQRAYNVIDHLVSQLGIDRSRLLLQYRGEDEAIVPLDKSVVNRRVEFLSPSVAGQTEDPAPAGASNGSGGY